MTYDPFDTSEDESTADGSLAVSDLKLDGTVTGITDVEVIDSRTDESSLPAVAAPQIQYVESTDSYRKSYGLEGRTIQAQFRTGTTSSQGSPTTGLEFSCDGSKLIEVGNGSNNIYQSSLSTAYDPTTASLIGSINTQSTNPLGIAFADSGSVMLELGAGSDNIYKYDLTTPFDISTATVQQTINTQDTQPEGVDMSPDGTKLYEAGSGSSLVYQSTLSTPYDLSTASLDLSFGTGEFNSVEANISDDGKRFIFYGNRRRFEVKLSTPFDLSTRTLVHRADSATQTTDIVFDGDGTTFYEALAGGGIGINTCGQREEFRNFSGGFDIKRMDAQKDIPITGQACMEFEPSGSFGVFADSSVSPTNLRERQMTTNYDISTLQSTVSASYALQDGDPSNLEFLDGGNKLFEFGAENLTVYQHTLSTPHDISTASFQSSVSLGEVSAGGNGQGSAVKEDGTKMFVTDGGSNPNKILEYDLTTANDVTTATFQASDNGLGTATDGDGFSSLEALELNNDGTELFLLDTGDEAVRKYTLSTPYDVTTLSLVDGEKIITQDFSTTDFKFKEDDGRKMFMIRSSFDELAEHSLGYEVDL